MDVSNRKIILWILLFFTWNLPVKASLTSPVRPIFLTVPPRPQPTFRLKPPVLQPKKICRENITKEEAISKYLPRCASCKDKCGSRSNLDISFAQGCSCDSSCVSYMDCCPDFTKYCHKEAKYSPSAFIPDRPASCRTIFGTLHYTENYLLVDSCQKNKTSCIVNRDSPNTFIPVWDVERRVHFVSLDCAVCNNAKTVIPWDNTLTCDKTEITYRKNISETITKDEFGDVWRRCNVDVIPKLDSQKTAPPKLCVSSIATPSMSCDSECAGTEFEKFCKNGHVTYLDHPFSAFTNFFCLLCVQPGLIDEVLDHTDCYIQAPIFSIIPPGPGYFSFHLLFDVDLRRGFIVGEEPVPECPERQVWVHTEQRCRFTYTDIHNKSMSELIIIFKIKNESLTSQIINDISLFLLNLSPYIQQNELVLLNNDTVAVTLFGTNLTAVTKDKVINETRKWFPNKEIQLLYITDYSTKLKCESNLHVYNRTEYEFITNGSVRILNSNRTVHHNEFRITVNYSIAVCPEPMRWKGLNAMSIVTIVCISLSIIAHIIRLILHCLLAEQGPARLQVCLVVSLLLAMVCFLLNPLVLHLFPVCYTVAVLIHWSFLAAFSWMTVIGWDILYMFKATSDFQRIHQGQRRFVIYSIYAWGFPTAIVGIALAIDHSHVNYIWHPAYAVNLCWISGKHGLLLYFVAPVALQVLMNIIIFVACIIYLHKNKMPQGNNTQEKQRFWLHIRLLILMGITWVVGFLAIPINSDALWYVFIILNASQGVFLLLVYILTRRTQQKVLEKLQKLRKSSTTQGTTGSTGLSNRT